MHENGRKFGPVGRPVAEAVNSDDADRAARIIRDPLGIESDDVVNYRFPKDWPDDRERRTRYDHVRPRRFSWALDLLALLLLR
jgi:hypothetical protein